jgi:sugar phosphate isomerase/epimerase
VRTLPIDDPGWVVTLFSFTGTLLEAQLRPDEIMAGILEIGLSRRIEIDAPQHFRSYPALQDAELDRTREVLECYGARLHVLGCYHDASPAPGVYLSPEQAVDRLSRQIRAAQRLGAWGVRVGLGYVPESVLTALVPVLEENDVMWVEEVQGPCRPDTELLRRRLELIERLATDHVRFLFDLSLCMPALPTSYVEALHRHGAAPTLIDRLQDAWNAADHRALVALLQAALASGQTPQLASLFITPLTRFGCSTVADWRSFLPNVAAVHLKYWDLDDHDGTVSTPIRQLREALSDIGFAGTFCSEWGGHEWMPHADPTAMTQGHRRLFDAAAPLSRSPWAPCRRRPTA